MFALMNNREGAALQAAALHATATRRRVIVAAHMVLTAASAAGYIGMFLTDHHWLVLVPLVLTPFWCVATGLINSATRGLLELRTRVLDERQLAERDRVGARAQRLTTYLLAAVLVGVTGYGLTGHALTGTLLIPVLFAVFVAHWLMPMWVAGLTAQDEPEPEPELQPGPTL
ncbi:hypothetical protein KGS77_26835 [Streptomyces sp. MST-110588]|nr:hypothetical protein KGS77_26835 [Streptomyces sp. MST-110588]